MNTNTDNESAQTSNRLLIRNQTHFVNFADSEAGLVLARIFRKTQPAFKRRRIKPVLQLKPSEVRLGEIMEITYSK